MLSKALFTDRTDILDGEFELETRRPSTISSGSVPKCSMVGLLAAAMKSSMLNDGAGLGFSSYLDDYVPGPNDIALFFRLIYSEFLIGGGDFLGRFKLLFGDFILLLGDFVLLIGDFILFTLGNLGDFC